MNTESIRHSGRVVANLIKQNSPTILTSLNAAGVFMTAALAVKATPKALMIIKDANDEFEYKNGGSWPNGNWDIIKLTWKCYIPATVMGISTILCGVGANSINLRRNAALASVYSLAEATLKEYQHKVVEVIGEKKEQRIRDEIAQDRVDKNPPSEGVIFVGQGETMCYDELSDRYFKSDMETLRRIQNDINRDLLQDMWISQNMVYDRMGLPHVKTGDDTGWNTDKQIDFIFSATLTKGVPCMVITFRHRPTTTFRN